MNPSAPSLRERPGVSVVVCCYNGATRLPATLAHLARQQGATGIFREVIVVDNASTDGSAAVALRNWPGDAPLRVVSEPRPGLSHARWAGAREAVGEIIAFVDDDNGLAPEWVARVASLFAEHPEVGACGGRSEAVLETSPPAWFEAVRAHYAVGSQFAVGGDITDLPGTLLWGAGLAVRRAALQSLQDRGFASLLQDRQGAELSSGGDTELCFVLRALGWRLWYDDALVLSHFIPASRMTWAYVDGLMRGLGAASVIFDIYLAALRQPPLEHYPQWKQTWGFQFARLLREGLALLVLHPRACLLAPEGSLPALQFRRVQGRFDLLWRLRGRYDELHRLIERKYAPVAPKVSVVMTVWNGAPHIGEAIGSILGQTFRDLELIVIDDGSTDDTCAVVESFQDARLRLVRRPHAGIPASANFGVALARGIYVARLDADDVSLPDRLARQVAALERHPRAVLCFTDAEVFGENLFGDASPTHRHARLCRDDALVRIQMCYRCPFLHSSVMYRRDAFAQAGGYPDRPVGEDFAFFTRLIDLGSFIAVPEKLVRYRRHGGSASSTRVEEMARITREICVEHASRFLEIDDAAADRLYTMLSRPAGRRDWSAWFFFCARVLRHASCWRPEPLGWLLSQTIRNATGILPNQ